MNTYDVLILGGGTAGITAAARIKNSGHFNSLAIVEPSDTHYYQPLWTLVGNGLVDKKITGRPMKNVIPAGVEWLQQSVKSINADEKKVLTDKEEIHFKYLIVATGIIADYDRVPGLKATLGKNGVCSIYDYNYADHCIEHLKTLDGGDCLFTMPAGMLKCGGAPQKIMWLSEDYVTRFKDRKKFTFHFLKEGEGIFGVEKYKKELQKMVEARDIKTHYKEELVKVDAERKVATFKNLDSGEEVERPYALLHVVPHFHTHDFLQGNAISNASGEVEVDAATLQGVKYPWLWSLGDCSSCPTGKTGAAVRKQAPVLVANLLAYDRGQKLQAAYNGYTACPILTRHNRVMLCEFDYNSNPVESFPFNQAKERYSMYLFKRYLLPWLYWHFMMRGHL